MSTIEEEYMPEDEDIDGIEAMEIELDELRSELEAMRDVMCRDCWDEYNRRMRGK